ncbi:MAG: hypothetical protein PHF25_03620, partial [Candidatus Margulisbacteria bacterium]|nr:hypothetical protein [Candidatus Margulisiibacteriota bacterium]
MRINFNRALHNLVVSLFFLIFLSNSLLFSATTAPTNLLVQDNPTNSAVSINETGTNVYFQAVYNSDRGPAVNYRIAVTTQNEFGIKDFVFWGENTANMV